MGAGCGSGCCDSPSRSRLPWRAASTTTSCVDWMVLQLDPSAFCQVAVMPMLRPTTAALALSGSTTNTCSSVPTTRVAKRLALNARTRSRSAAVNPVTTPAHVFDRADVVASADGPAAGWSRRSGSAVVGGIAGAAAETTSACSGRQPGADGPEARGGRRRPIRGRVKVVKSTLPPTSGAKHVTQNRCEGVKDWTGAHSRDLAQTSP